MYVVYLDLNEFLDHAGPVVHLQTMQSTTERCAVAALFLTSRVEPHGPIHGARMVVMRELQKDYQAAVTRAGVTTAIDCLTNALTERGRVVEPGLCLVPGLLVDLEQIDTYQSLWTTRRNGHNSWEIVVTARAVS